LGSGLSASQAAAANWQPSFRTAVVLAAAAYGLIMPFELWLLRWTLARPIALDSPAAWAQFLAAAAGTGAAVGALWWATTRYGSDGVRRWAERFLRCFTLAAYVSARTLADRRLGLWLVATVVTAGVLTGGWLGVAWYHGRRREQPAA
jgi:hypothetical protein